MKRLSLFVVCVALSAIHSDLVGQEWTRFHGPNGTGASEAKNIPVRFDESDYNWKTKLPGIGHSSPVIWGERVFVLSADPENATRYCLALDAKTGAIVWQREFKSTVHHLHARSSFASSTPACDADHVYFAWSTPDATWLKAFDHQGKEVWSKDLGRWVSQHGFGTSPIVYQGLVILHNSQQANQLKEGQKPGESFMVACRRKTGEEVWRTPLKSMNVCYSVPFIFRNTAGQDELICTSTGNGFFSLDPLTGKQNWAVADVFKMRTVASPILAGGLIFGSTGSGAYSGNYIAALKPGPDAEVVYEIKNSGKFKAPYVPTYVAHGDKVFFIYDRGFSACVDAPTGKIHYSERTGANFSGSPIRVADKIYAIDEDGVVWVWAASAEYKELAKNPLGEPSRSTPAVADGKLYLRTESHLISVGS
ncbi:MAG: hypothetical protein CL681_24570 [Blastopirellula sp.]|nr:hypothetical protein [Blastopirellula sp.]